MLPREGSSQGERGDRQHLCVRRGREREKQTPLLSEMLLKTRGSFCMSNESCAGHTNHLELPVGIQYTSSNCFRRFPLSTHFMCRVQRDTVSYLNTTCHLYLGRFSSLCRYFTLFFWLPCPSHNGSSDAGDPCTLTLVTLRGACAPWHWWHRQGPCTPAPVTMRGARAPWHW